MTPAATSPVESRSADSVPVEPLAVEPLAVEPAAMEPAAEDSGRRRDAVHHGGVVARRDVLRNLRMRLLRPPQAGVDRPAGAGRAPWRGATGGGVGAGARDAGRHPDPPGGGAPPADQRRRTGR